MTKVNIIEGIATSPSQTTHGDCVDVKGLRWTLPMPLLRNHDSSARVGEVVALWLDYDYLPRTGELTHIVRFRAVVQDETAWDDIVAGDLPAVSIYRHGFASSGDILDLSVCKVGANPDAQIKIIGTIESHMAADRNAPIKRFNFPVMNLVAEPARPEPEKAYMPANDPWQMSGAAFPHIPKRILDMSQEDRTPIFQQYIEAETDHVKRAMKTAGADAGDVSTALDTAILGGSILAHAMWTRTLLEDVIQRVVEMESNATVFRGSYQRAQDYKRGSLVSHRGALWCAITSVSPGEVPGEGKGWQLCVKRGDLDD